MPLSCTDPARREIHHRRIDVRGFERDDGLWDIEGRLTDVKSYAFANKDRGMIEAGDPVHDLSLRLTIDLSLRVHAAEAVIDKSPFSVCPEVTEAYGRLVGLTIGPGFRRAAAERVGGARGCTHLSELLGPVATTAFQTLHRAQLVALDQGGAGAERAAAQMRTVVDSCHALRADGPVIAREWPDLAQSSAPPSDAG
ncbi:DUF2889 domain-containing protein [Pararhodospirillum oryzae]|nr:DUF2889 domain-containing protein [Pararhodospirillum oryzae]